MGRQTDRENQAITPQMLKEECGSACRAPAPIPGWKRIPLTAGLLVVIIVGVGAAWQAVASMGDRLRASRTAAIKAHSQSYQAHPGIRAAVKTHTESVTRQIEALRKDMQVGLTDIKQMLRMRRGK